MVKILYSQEDAMKRLRQLYETTTEIAANPDVAPVDRAKVIRGITGASGFYVNMALRELAENK
ncbi:MAG: hypothetical protein WAQ25_02095 [Candidatus Saccharimonas sp.]